MAKRFLAGSKSFFNEKCGKICLVVLLLLVALFFLFFSMKSQKEGLMTAEESKQTISRFIGNVFEDNTNNLEARFLINDQKNVVLQLKNIKTTAIAVASITDIDLNSDGTITFIGQTDKKGDYRFELKIQPGNKLLKMTRLSEDSPNNIAPYENHFFINEEMLPTTTVSPTTTTTTPSPTTTTTTTTTPTPTTTTPNPNALYNNVHLWVDAQTSSCYDNASNITVLYDKSGQNNHTNYRKVVGAGTAAITPINGKNYIRLNKVGFLIGNGDGKMTPYNGETYCFFCVISINNNSSNPYPRIFSFGSYPPNRNFNDNWTSTEWILYLNIANLRLGRGITPESRYHANTDTMIDPNYTNLSTPSILSIWFDGKNRYIRLNGNVAVSAPSPGKFSINLIGINNNVFDPYQTSGGNENSGDFNYGEYITYKNAPTTEQIEKIEGYLATKWDLRSKLPQAHPYSTSKSAFTNVLNNI